MFGHEPGARSSHPVPIGPGRLRAILQIFLIFQHAPSQLGGSAGDWLTGWVAACWLSGCWR
jgi:hypothetical protein